MVDTVTTRVVRIVGGTMPLTVGQVAALPDLGLQLRTSGSGLER